MVASTATPDIFVEITVYVYNYSTFKTLEMVKSPQFYKIFFRPSQFAHMAAVAGQFSCSSALQRIKEKEGIEISVLRQKAKHCHTSVNVLPFYALREMSKS